MNGTASNIPFMIFMSGAIFSACMVCCVFFLRFWTKTKDRFFIFLGVAFGFLALERFLLVGSETPDARAQFYICRLISFALIIYAILDKNRKQKG